MMQHRHRVPTIFSIYMLDVICCALGCVVLLWQVAHQEASEQTAKAEVSQKEAEQQSSAAKLARQKFETAQKDLTSASGEVADLQAILLDLRKKHENVSLALTATQKDRDEARKAVTLSDEQLKKLLGELAQLRAENEKTNAELTAKLKVNKALNAQIASLKNDIDKKQTELDAATKKWLEQVAMLKQAADSARKQQDDIDKIRKALTLSDEQRKKTEKEIALLKIDVADRQANLLAATKKGEEQTVALRLSEDNLRKLQKLLDTLRDDNKDTQTKLKLSELQLMLRDQELDKMRTQVKDLLAGKDKTGKELASGAKDLNEAKSLIASLAKERDELKEKLASAGGAIGELKTETKKLNQQVVDLQTEADQRFAGVQLTGENVIFLIDVSGSMIMKDARNEDAEKWPYVCDTLMKLMRSIRTMKRFQVILFSDKTSYLFGNRDYWLKYEGPETAKVTREALRKFEVAGGTNMHDAFDEAFRYRKSGLDTIYLFSDGLPNAGPGLPPNIPEPTATEEQKNFHMGKAVREKLKRDWNRPIEGKEPVRINSIGFYYDSPDVGAFLWAMSREHRGNFVGLR